MFKNAAVGGYYGRKILLDGTLGGQKFEFLK